MNSRNPSKRESNNVNLVIRRQSICSKRHYSGIDQYDKHHCCKIMLRNIDKYVNTRLTKIINRLSQTKINTEMAGNYSGVTALEQNILIIGKRVQLIIS